MTPLRILAELVGSFLIVAGIIGAHLLAFAEEKPHAKVIPIRRGA